MSHSIEVTLRQQQAYQFIVDFGQAIAPLHTDEAAPLGGGTGPTPVQLLAAAVGNCLSDSLVFALAKFKDAPQGLTTRVQATIDRNAQGRMRVATIEVELRLGALAAAMPHLERVLGQFEDFCTVAQSIGQGIPITVRVFDGAGVQVK